MVKYTQAWTKPLGAFTDIIEINPKDTIVINKNKENHTEKSGTHFIQKTAT